jgi:hypothetical protein
MFRILVVYLRFNETPLSINDYRDNSNNIETFLHHNQSQLARTRRTHVFIDTGQDWPHVYPTRFGRLGLSPGSKIAVSFFGPPSGNLVLKLTHSPQNAAAVTLILKEPHGSRTFEYPVSSSLTVTTMTHSPGPSDNPSLMPNTRNNLIIEVSGLGQRCYTVRDVQLHDEVGNDYNPDPPEA